MNKNIILLILFLTAIYFTLWGNDENHIKYSGLLYGKNYYVPHLLTYSFPGFSPRKGNKGDISSSLTYSGINEFALYDKDEVALDYESSLLNSSFTYRLLDRFLIGADFGIISYYGGFMDPIIDIWHNIFNFPDAGREYYSNSELEVLIENSEGKNLTLDDEVIFLGDTDLYGIWNIKENKNYSASIATVIKLPTGSYKYLTSSGYIDLGIQVLAEFYKINNLVIGFQQGLVFPGDVILQLDNNDNYASRIQSQTFLSLQYYPNNKIGLITQFRINSSPIRSDKIKINNFLGNYTYFTLPQTSLILGIKKYFGSLLTEVSIEEDLLTYEGVDIQFSFRVSKLL